MLIIIIIFPTVHASFQPTGPGALQQPLSIDFLQPYVIWHFLHRWHVNPMESRSSLTQSIQEWTGLTAKRGASEKSTHVPIRQCPDQAATEKGPKEK